MSVRGRSSRRPPGPIDLATRSAIPGGSISPVLTRLASMAVRRNRAGPDRRSGVLSPARPAPDSHPSPTQPSLRETLRLLPTTHGWPPGSDLSNFGGAARVLAVPDERRQVATESHTTVILGCAGTSFRPREDQEASARKRDCLPDCRHRPTVCRQRSKMRPIRRSKTRPPVRRF